MGAASTPKFVGTVQNPSISRTTPANVHHGPPDACLTLLSLKLLLNKSPRKLHKNAYKVNFVAFSPRNRGVLPAATGEQINAPILMPNNHVNKIKRFKNVHSDTLELSVHYYHQNHNATNHLPFASVVADLIFISITMSLPLSQRHCSFL